MNAELTTVLQEAISETGIWTWWTEDFPASMQLEFHHCQFFFPSIDPEEAYSSQIAIRFFNPVSVNFVSTAQAGLPADWPWLFHQEKLDYMYLDGDAFTFENDAILEKVLRQARAVDTVHGIPPWDPVFPDAKIHFAFMAGEAGCIIAAERVGFFTHQGEIPPKKLSEYYDSWIAYWKSYWEKRDTEGAFPEDMLCESIIPSEEIEEPPIGPSGGNKWIHRIFGKQKK